MSRLGLWMIGMAATTMVASCGPANGVRSQIESDVKLEPAKDRPDESVTLIQWKQSGRGTGQVSIEFPASGGVLAKRYEAPLRRDGSRELITIILDSPEIDKVLLRKIRARLANYRPAELNGYVFPKDCGMVMDGGPALAHISFKDASGKKGGFILQPECQNDSSRIIAQDIKEIVAMLPPLKGTSGYGWIP